jgi:hypothetical protein
MASRVKYRPDKVGLVCAIAGRADKPVAVPDAEHDLLIPIFRNEIGVDGDAVLYQLTQSEAHRRKPLLNTLRGCADHRMNRIQIVDRSLSPYGRSANRYRGLRNGEAECQQQKPNAKGHIHGDK